MGRNGSVVVARRKRSELAVWGRLVSEKGRRKGGPPVSHSVGQ